MHVFAHTCSGSINSKPAHLSCPRAFDGHVTFLTFCFQKVADAPPWNSWCILNLHGGATRKVQMPHPWDRVKVIFLRYCPVLAIANITREKASSLWWIACISLILIATHEVNFMAWYCIKRIEIDPNIFKSNAHRSPQRQRHTRKDHVCRENSLKEGLSHQTKILFVFVIKTLITYLWRFLLNFPGPFLFFNDSHHTCFSPQFSRIGGKTKMNFLGRW